MVKISSTLLAALVVAAPALAVPAYRRDSTETNVYQRASDAVVENLVSREPFFGVLVKKVDHQQRDLTERDMEDLVEREPFFGLLANIAKIGLKVGMRGAKVAKKVHSAHDKYNRHKRDLDEESLAAREFDDEELLERDLGEELEERDVDAELEERYIEDLD